MLSWIYAESKGIKINFHSIELYPITEDLVAQINYPSLIGHQDKFQALHTAKWDETIELSPHFSLHKLKASILDFRFPSSSVNVVFFDAFSPEKQPEIWTVDVFAKVYDILTPGGILVTYCSKSAVRKDMQQVGFMITKLPGPHGKRDMVRATKH